MVIGGYPGVSCEAIFVSASRVLELGYPKALISYQ